VEGRELNFSSGWLPGCSGTTGVGKRARDNENDVIRDSGCGGVAVCYSFEDAVSGVDLQRGERLVRVST